ncbi:amino acid adenylation domain-containing protein [Orbus sturtevantii]|uniref:amino acid adenylation domain-containing protein n=1 Tax=Orbus sturtevantii TaxID=3074109 RepID=UPI00370D85AE
MQQTKLTPYQSIFYYEWLNNPSRSDYNIVIDNTLTGKLDKHKYNNSFERLLNEHFITRHVITDTEEGLCWQRIDSAINITSFHENPLSDEQIYLLVTQPFDLHHGPLVRIHLIKLADECHRMILIFHHIVVDGISTAEIWDKWRKLYNGIDYLVPSLSQQTIMHQNLYQYFENLLTNNKTQIYDFWRTHLHNLSGIDLKFLQSYQANLNPKAFSSLTEHSFSYDEKITKQVSSLRRKYKITPYLFGQLVMAIMLNKMSGLDNIGLAYPIAILEGKALLYGSHINTMIIDYRFDKQTTLDSLINQTLIFYKQLKASNAKYLPINEIITCGGDSSLLNIAFVQTFYRDHETGLIDIKNESINHNFQVDLASKLLFEQQEHNNQINYRVRFDSDLLDDTLVKNFIQFYQKLFIDILAILTAQQGYTFIKDINLIDPNCYFPISANNHTDLVFESNIIKQFECMVSQFPDRKAIIYKDQHLTYQQLNQKSNQLARYLVANFNLQADDLIALCIEKSALMPICILAILKAGGAYVPIDPKAPKQRVSYILQDTKAKAILTDHGLNKSLDLAISETRIPRINIDSTKITDTLASYPNGNLNLILAPHQLAYIIYTSGTTGVPKGVMIEHGGLINLAIVQGREVGLAPSLKTIKNSLWYASYVFDAHVSELFIVIANGHILHIIEEDIRLDFNLLANYINANKIDIATIPPALLNKDQLLKLKTLIVAGESCNIEIMTHYRQQGTQVINAYGPTESTVCATLHHYQIGDSNLNIGRPLNHITAYILDDNLIPVPLGVIGNLYLSGIGLARGYLNDKAQTEQVFIANPFVSDDPNQKRLYRTGDLARQLFDSCIEYIGRKDFQVKIRGFRIELAEIENCLTQLSQISQAIVLPYTLSSGLKTLVAYYIAQDIVDDELILKHLTDYLPEYMLPNIFIHLNKLPLTVNGKLDRLALPEPNFNKQNNYIAPTNQTEAILCDIYAEVLNVGKNKVGIDDDFFKLGGDSISAILLVSKIRHKLAAILAIKDIFTTKTVRLLAKNINIEKIEKDVKIISEQGQLSGSFKLLPIQQWFFERVEQGKFCNPHHWNQSFILDVPLLNVDLLQQSLTLLVSYHDALRLTFTRDNDGSYHQHYAKNVGEIPFNYITLTTSKYTQEQLFNQWQHGFDIYHAPLSHIGYVESKNCNRAQLHFAFHHLIIDAVSWHIIKQDLQKIYQTLHTHPQKKHCVVDILGEKSSSYRQWVAQIQDYRNDNQIEKEQTYWLDVTKGITAYRQQITPLFNNKQLNCCKLSLDKDYTANLQSKIHQVLSTQINDILLASFIGVLKQFTSIDQHYITLEGHGRELLSPHLDINRTVGWFTNMYPVTLSTDDNILSHIANIKDSLASMPRRGIGFAALFGYQDDMLSPISFNYLGQFDGVSQDDWQFSFINPGTTISDQNRPTHDLSIDCGIVEGELKITLMGHLDQIIIEQLATSYQAVLRSTIDQLLAIKRHYLTVTDIHHTISAHLLGQLQQHTEIEHICLANSLQEGFIYHAINQGKVDDAYRTQMFWDYQAPIDTSLLKQAWQLVQANYASLRLRFNWHEELIQIINKSAKLNWSYFDISNQLPEQQQLFVAELCHNDRNQPYDLTLAGLFRIYLIKYNQQHYHCIFSSHHAILDGWSNPILIKAVHDTYLKLVNHVQINLPIDYSYQNIQDYLQKHRTEHLQYWLQYLSKQQTKDDLSLLLTDSKRAIHLNDYKHITLPMKKSLIIDGELYSDLKAITRQYGITANAILQYCWHKVLNVYTGNNDTIVGVVVAGRNLPVEGIEQTVGLLINTLPLIVDHQTSDSLLAVIQILQQDINEANSRSNVNLAELQPAGQRLFNSLFVFENYPLAKNHEDNELKLNFIGTEEKQDYPLVMTVLDETKQLILTLHYAAELFDNTLIDNLFVTFKQIVTHIIKSPQAQQNNIDYLNEQQYQMVIYDWNNTASNYYADKTVISLFEQLVDTYADYPAVLFNDITLTYRQLNQQANQLAHYLQSIYQLKPNDFVGLYLTRSEKIVVSILAVLKTGAAYVPMDIDAPDERNQFIVTDTNMQAIITEQINYAKVSLFTSNIIVIDRAETTTALLTKNPNDPINNTQSHDLAYCIYTSGTTGKPKGTLISHRNINRLVVNPNYTHITQHDRLLAISGYQFDASIYDIFATLLNGASVVIAEKQLFLDLNKLNILIHKNRITNCFITTAFFNTLVDAELSSLAHLNYVLVGGETLSTYHINRFRKLYPNVKLANVYGPTETTTYATAFLTNMIDTEFNYSVPIGRPINNTTLYVLNNALKPVPIGAVGELYIGGGGVGLGYLNNAELTAKAFINNPFQTEDQLQQGYNGRLYKTGDLVRYLSDGNIEYLGRNDLQVKIRGFRIELAEIEAQLIKYPTIQQARVIVNDNGQNDKHLIAYYVALQPISREQLFDYLQQSLPDYMLPKALVHLEALPLTINGKVDRAALSAATFDISHEHMAPVTLTEQQVSQFYSELLAINSDHISTNDDFFRLGGNSILAIKLASRLATMSGKAVHVADIFNHKTIQSLSRHIDSLNKEQLVITVSKVNRAQEQYLSFAQERLWFIDSYEGGTNAYNIPLTLSLKPTSSLTILIKALNKIIERHEILRTVIKINEQGEGYQYVLDINSAKCNIVKQICQNIDELNHNINRHVHHIFNLSSQMPLSAESYQLDGQTYLSIVIHHIAFDGWSIDLLNKELTYYYHFYNQKTDLPDLPDIAVQYKDFALWQRDYLQGERLESQLDYWRVKLHNYQSLDLPIDYVRPPKVDYSGDDIYFSLSKQTSDKLRQVAAHLNVSLYTVLLSGYYLLLKAYSNQLDIILGTPIAGRHYPGIENTLGFFVNTLALRRQISDEESLTDFIQATAGLLSEAQQQQDLPFEKLVDALQIEKDPARHPLFQVMFGVQSFGSLAQTDSQALFTSYQTKMAQYKVAKFDLSTMLDDSKDAISGIFNYATALFKAETIEGYIKTYCYILEQVSDLAVLQEPIKQLRYLDERQYQTVIYDWNKTECDYYADQTVISLFEAQVIKSAHYPAVIFNDITLSYEQLNQQANQLAHHIKSQYSIKPNDFVGLYLNRSEQIVVTMLAVLKAGAAYVPIDPDTPNERNRFIISDANVKVVITQRCYQTKIATFSPDVPLIVIEQSETDAILSLQRHDNIITATKSTDLAYCIYTSGTTGKPKGTLITHRNINRLVINPNYTEISPNDRFLDISGYQFDASIYDIFAALLNGAGVVIVEKQRFLNLTDFNQLILDNQISNCFITAAFFNTLVEAELPNLGRLNYILVGGEALSVYHINRFRQLYPTVKLVNGYGPTETTTFAVTYQINSANVAFRHSVPIGRPINNTSLYILDSCLRPVPVGAVGELYIGGAGVGLGYLNNPQLTAKVFIDNPFQTLDQRLAQYNGHLYKTGDLVRYLADGNIEYLGRNDFQVKIRGFRIELAEIESYLHRYSTIKQALVIANTDDKGNKQLVAYYVAGKPISHGVLFDYLQQSLPEYMIPSAFIHLSALPLTLNGKVDRNALPTAATTDIEGDYIAPASPTEQQVTALYAELLSVNTDESISVMADFFRMGGNSILAIKLASRLSHRYSKIVHVADIFSYKTVRGLSHYIDTLAGSQYTIQSQKVEHAEQQLLSFAQERLWFIDSYARGSNAYNIPIILKLSPQISLEVLAKTLNKIITRHEILRTIIKTNRSGEGYQNVLPIDMATLTIDHKPCHNIGELNSYIAEHVHNIFDLATQIPLSAQSYQLEKQTYFSLVIHHIAFDGWSIDLLIKELHYYYNVFSSSTALPELPPVKVQYKDFALWQRQYLHGAQLQSQLNYWCDHLQDYQPLNLPLDNPRPLQIDYSGADLCFNLTKETSQNLRQLAANLNVSLYTVLLSGYYLLLKAYSNQSDIILGTPIAGRHYLGIENTMGFFVNTLALRHKIDNNMPVIDFIKATGELLSQAQQYQDLPFEKLVDTLVVEQEPSRHPLFQVMFGVQSFGAANQPLNESLFTPYQTDSLQYNIAKFDLTTILDDSAEAISGYFNYATALFKPETISGYIDTYCHILDEIIKLSVQQQQIKQLTYLDNTTYDKVLYQWNQTQYDYPRNKTIAQMFEAQVAITPDNIALVYEGYRLTYRALNEQANQLAHYLQNRLMLQGDDLIAICLDKAPQLIVTILAVLKTGAAYVPLSPQLPAERKHWLIDDTQCKAIITILAYQTTLNKVLNNSNALVVCLDDANVQEQLTAHRIENTATTTMADNLAYVIYTSGTTGKPKGVMIEHHSVINATFVQQAAMGLQTCNVDTTSKNTLWYSDYTFDAHVLDIFTPLLTGNCLHIFAQNKRLDLPALIDYASTQHIDYAFIPPVLLDKNQVIPIGTILVGGEMISQNIVDYYYQQRRPLINAYGPTEASIWATYRQYGEGDINNNIGKPIYNVSVYILDSELRPVPIGAYGELYIGGAGVGRGYLNNIELSDKAFITNPFQSEKQKITGENSRLYKTGDIVRYFIDGNIQYLGRNDLQVKIRGFRIELSEIETRLLEHPYIKQALVLAHDSSLGDKQLIAYYVAEKTIDHEELFDHLQQSLPEYMIPGAFIYLDTLPLTLNGKINKAVLPAAHINITANTINPLTDTEHKVTEIYCELLAIEANAISVTDNFFRMGGNSILAMKLATKLSDKTGKAVHIADIFNYKTIQAISQYIDSIASHQLMIMPFNVHRVQDQQLSFAQERLWFIDNYEGGSNAYNIPLTLMLGKQVSLAILTKALHKIIERHEILRTVIKVNIDGIGYQDVLAADSIEMTIEHTICDDTAGLNLHISKHINRVFALATHIPLSAQSYQLGEQTYLSLVIHHIAFDGWSIDLLIKELNYYYRFFESLSAMDELPAIQVQYKDFALWQRQYLRDERLQSQLDYWCNRLADHQPLNLPTDHPRPINVDYHGADIRFNLTLDSSQKLRQLAADLNVSLYTVLLSGYYLLLKAYSNQSDIILGTPIAGRHYPGVENTMGFFVNTLALRREIDPMQSLTDFIQATGRLLNEAQQYQDLPFEKLVDALKIEKDSSRHPLFQVMFGLQSFGLNDKTGSQSLFTPYQTNSSQYNIAKFDLSTMLDDSQTVISGNFNYATALFNAETVKGYIDVYCYILQQLSDLVAQKKSIKQVRYLDDNNYNLLINQWNQTRQIYPTNKTIHQMFEEQVARTPNHTAVIYKDNRWTYCELNSKANQLAGYLRDNFTTEVDNLVALYLDRSLYMPTAILAVLKSGAAYVPIDPLAPSDRAHYILTNTKAKVILTVNRYYDKCCELAQEGQIVVNLQSSMLIEQLSHYIGTNLSPRAKPNSLAYVIYTSGTTGNAKGVMIEHQSVINKIYWRQKKYPLTENDRVLQKTNYAFDVSVWELFWANWYGATIVFADSELYKDNLYLVELIMQEGITTLHFVPSMLATFLETLEGQVSLRTKLKSLRYLFCSGEALNLEDVKKCHRLIPDCQIHNLYGPTETTIEVTYYDCNNPNLTSIFIGKPIANTSIYILDESLQPVPTGGIGELYIGGDPVARGYLYNQVLSDERFIINPFQNEQEKHENYNSRIYKTGDVVRYMHDGNIEYLGRNDFQVKIRGYRIELKEIEACLTKHSAISHAIAIAYERPTKDKYLVAYYVAHSELNDDVIIQHLRQTLPEYMLPVAFVHLTTLPITSNGKLDRSLLPKPEFNNTVAHILPNNEAEKILCEIFSDTLNIASSEISMEHSFFTLGGNSILAMKLNSRINQVFQVRLSLVDILNSRTIRELALKVMTTDKLEFNPVVPLTAISDKPQIFMIHPGMGGCSVYLSLANKLASHYCCYGVDSYNFYHENKIDQLDTLANYYLSYIDRVLDASKPITLLGWSLGGQIALEIATILEARNIRNITICALDTWLLNPDDLTTDIPIIDLDKLMAELNIPKYLRPNVVSVTEVDKSISLQPISAKLKETNVILFKAIEELQFGALHKKYLVNNIDSYLCSAQQLSVIDLATDHYRMLEKEQEIMDVLINLL